MDGAGNDQELLVVPLQLREGVSGEVDGVGLFAVDDENGAFDFAVE